MTEGQVIKKLRKDKQISQETLAASAGITQTAMSQIENGRRPRIKTMAKIAKELGIPPTLIYTMAMDRKDFPVSRRPKFDNLFPVLQQLLLSLTKDEG